MLAAAAFSSLIALRSIHVEELETDVPVAARIWLADAKHTFRDLAAEVLDQEPACIEERLSKELEIPLECEDCSFGSVNTLEVTAHDDFVAVEVGLSIPYDTDSALYLFRHGQLVYQREVNDYERIGEALGSFQWELSRPGADGSRLIITTAISPSPASNWQMLTYTVDRIDPYCDEPVAIDRGKTSIFLSGDFELHVAPDRYALRFLAENYEPLFTRTRVLKFELDGDRPLRVDPVAESPADFLVEWLSMPDDEAMRWSDVERRDLGEGFRWFESINQCVDGLWQLHLNADDEATHGSQTAYFIVGSENGTFRVHEIRDELRPGCPDEPSPNESKP